MIANIYWLNKTNLKIKFMLKYLSSLNYEMAYSETRIVIGGLAHVPVLIFIANFIKGKFGIKTEEAKDIVVKKGKEATKELSNKLDSLEQKANEVYEKVKNKKKDKKKKKK